MSKKPILEDIHTNFKARTGYTVIIGVEQEFYIMGAGSIQDDELERRIAALSRHVTALPFFSEIEKERGAGQCEAQIDPTDSPAVMAGMVEMFREIILKNEDASFAAKPYPNQPGSGMHINVNLLDEAGRNVFSKDGETESQVLESAIAGLLELMPASMKYFAPYDAAYIRYVQHGMESPSTISWGPDNRTVSLRIPSVPLTPHARRIEHRVSCADADPYLAIAAIIAGIEYGLVNKLQNKHPKIFGNAFLPQYSLPRLPQSFAEAQSIKNEYLEHVMSRFN